MEFRIGERVFIKPTNPAIRVQRGANLFGQFLSVQGQECSWDHYLASRLNEGSITVSPIPVNKVKESAPPKAPNLSPASEK